MASAKPVKNIRILARVVIQRCLSASIDLSRLNEDSLEPVSKVNIGKGLVVFVCFFSGASMDTVSRMVQDLIHAETCESHFSETSHKTNLTSLCKLPGNLLLIPHFTLGGKLKGHKFQYHSVCDKVTGQELFEALVNQCNEALMVQPEWCHSGCSVKCGVYGRRQVLSMETNGPFTHILEW